jgi:hypothetical protein
MIAETVAREYNTHPSTIGFFVATLFTGLLLSCVVPADAPVETLHVGKVTASDTIPPWGEIRLSFSVPADDTVLPRFDFNPPFYSYTVTMNDTRDTAFLAWSEPLAGAQRYVFRISEFSDQAGNIIPCADSIIIVTYPTENEPNDTRETSDTLTTSRWGTIATVNDTDWFTAPEKPEYALVLNSTGSQTSFAVVGRNGMLGSEMVYKKSDTLRVADSLPSPLMIAVFAYHRSVGGYYEVRRTPSK